MSLNIGFIGFGLTGGSIAKAIRRRYPAAKMSAYDIDTSALQRARGEGILDTIWDNGNMDFSRCSFLFLCTEVSCSCAYLKYLREDIAGTDCILTDVSSVKSTIHKEIQKVGLTANFIGGHPLFFEPSSGYEHSDMNLIAQAPHYILTPSEDISVEKLSSFTQLISSLGPSPLVLTPQEHDYILAGVRHLPQLLDAAFLSMIDRLDNPGQDMKLLLKKQALPLCGTPSAWEKACLENAPYISNILDEYIRTLIQLRCQLDQQDERSLEQLFQHTWEYKSDWLPSEGESS